jgi:hypothetical protein
MWPSLSTAQLKYSSAATPTAFVIPGTGAGVKLSLDSP